ncbi:MAG TPA: GumC family protein [Bacillota bacterium]|nr:GumC family protein [Bacillota bacterium]
MENRQVENFNLQKIITVLFKNSFLIFGIILLCGIIAGVTSFKTPPTYQAETTIRVKKARGLTESLLSGANDVHPMELQQVMSTYSEIIKGRTVIENTIDKVYKNQKERPSYQGLAGCVNTEPVKDTELLKITVRSGSPREAAVLANTLVDAFLERLSKLGSTEQRSVRGFLGERLEHSKLELQQIEKELEQYKRRREIVAPREETEALVNRVSQLNQLTAENQINLATAQSKLDNINQQLGAEKDEFIADSPLIQNYKNKLADLEIKLVGLVQQYTEKHPNVIALNAEMDATRKLLDIEIKRVINASAPSGNPIHLNLLQNKLATEIELAAAQAQKFEMDQVQSRAEREILALPTKERELARLMREVDLSQEIYLMLAKRHEEARISEVMQPTDVQVVEKAVIPQTPVEPKKVQNIMMAVALGLFSGVGLAFLLESLNKTINTAHDVQNYMGLPVVGSIQDFKTIKKSKTGTGSYLRAVPSDNREKDSRSKQG